MMSGEEAKTILRGMVSIMKMVNMKNSDPLFGSYLEKMNEAVEVSCAAIDMTEDRLDIEGGKDNE